MHPLPFTRPDSAAVFAADWIDAWNTRDLERILDHYDDDIVFRSPFVVAFGERSGTLSGKPALRSYFERALARLPAGAFDLDRVLVGVSSIAVCYRGAGGVAAVEVMASEDGRRVTEVVCHYPAPGPRKDGSRG